MILLQQEQRKECGGDEKKTAAFCAFWAHVNCKWKEIMSDSLYNDEGMEALAEAEAELEARYGDAMPFRPYEVQRRLEEDGADSSDGY
eukprot:CAMPEP_0184313030 /NCGR_PEP_ID=MMETSP1049-20130417/58446_1 /TAXON_ID=77928 /ORGANISM="Proteomonas sulcata, Strain CCMP704" /LENGTH=87 /DNA_ID=CAMNT_0026629859 /DNA_START=84 /DNA_END=347 /DNA_ORIENTATION=+